MPKLFLFEDAAYADLLPLTYWRSVFELRVGRRILLDRIAQRLGTPISGIWTRDWIAAVAGERCSLPVNRPVDADCVLVNGLWPMTAPVTFAPAPFIGIGSDDRVAYIACDAALAKRLTPAVLLDVEATVELVREFPHGPINADLLRHPWDVVHRSAELLRSDWSGVEDAAIIGLVHASTVLVEPRRIHIGDGAIVKPLCVLDASDGPVYVSDNVIVEPHSVLMGPIYVGVGTLVRPHAVIRGGTSVGPVCKVGGEIDACVISGYSNKQHDGFLGHAYVGNWVNIGAGTTNSDLKNTYGAVRAATPHGEADTAQMFYGGVIADHVKLGINQSIPTGASIGFAATIASSRIVPKFVPSLAWLTDAGITVGDAERLIATAQKVMSRRHTALSEAEIKLFHHIAGSAQQIEIGARGMGPSERRG
jgi:UDP-N-acetylglucosamine diphosphorylase/glucosamine-1-phosphate N-acetyltransferase